MTTTLAPQTALERRYRRLLACYPAAYRTEYGEEMIGVLLASTPPDQDRPTKAATFDLIGGGLRVWFRLLRTGDGDSPWRNTLAVFSVIAPVLLFVTVTGNLVVSFVWQQTFPFFAQHSDTRLNAMPIVSTIALVASVACPILMRRGRIAARAATTIAVVAITSAVAVTVQLLVEYGPHSWLDYLTSMLVIEIVAVLFSPGPGRGWRLLGRWGLVLLVATAAALVAAAGVQIAWTVNRHASGTFDLWNLGNSMNAIAPVLGVTLIAITLRWPAGGRLLAVFAIPGYLLSGFNAVEYVASDVYPVYWRLPVLAAEIEYLPVLAIAALIAAAVWRSGRRRRPRVPGSTS